MRVLKKKQNTSVKYFEEKNVKVSLLSNFSTQYTISEQLDDGPFWGFLHLPQKQLIRLIARDWTRWTTGLIWDGNSSAPVLDLIIP